MLIPMSRVKVFRSGVVAPPASRGCEADVYSAVDAMRPFGHPTRTQGIFAAPRIEGVIRWVRGNDLSNLEDVAVREITVDSDLVTVYRVNDWERVSNAYDRKGDPSLFSERVTNYFEHSMSLTQWLAGDYEADQWEVIFHASDVISSHKVGVERLMLAAKSEFMANDIKHIYQRHARMAR